MTTDITNGPGTGVSRERVIEAIYETVLRPDQFGEFMDVWSAHIQSALPQFDDDTPIADAPDDLNNDNGLHAHFHRAYAFLEQFGRPLSPQHSTRAVEAAAHVALLLCGDGTVKAASVAARAFLADALTVAALNDRLNVASTGLLRDVLTAVRSGGGAAPDAVLVTDGAPRHLIARVIEVQNPAGGIGHLVSIEALDCVWTERAEDILVTSFSLSRAEVDVVRNLLAGKTLKQIAAASGRSEHTVRNQAKSVLSKTGAPGQSDLIRLVAYLLNHDAPETAAVSGGPALTFETMVMRSGLRMQLFRAGAADGRPVLFLNGILDGSAPVRFLQEYVAARGMQLIAPLRPGFGQSDPSPSPDRMAGLYLDHLSEMIDRLELGRPVVLGNMTGCVFGHILSCRLPEGLAGLVAVSGGLPIRRLRQVQRMAPRQRAIFLTARYTPKVLPTVLRAGIAQLDRGDTEDFMTAMHRDGTPDLELIRARELGPLIRSGYGEAVEQGYRGFADEALFMVRDWTPDIAAPHCPILFISGAEDPVVNPRDIETEMSGRPGVQVQILPGVGQLILYDRPDLVLDAVETLAG